MVSDEVAMRLLHATREQLHGEPTCEVIPFEVAEMAGVNPYKDYTKGGLKDMAQGNVKWFSKERGYGFISPLGGGEEVFVEDFFVRNSGVAGARSTTLEEEERVLYQVTRDEWGATAENVCVLRSSRPAVR